MEEERQTLTPVDLNYGTGSTTAWQAGSPSKRNEEQTVTSSFSANKKPRLRKKRFMCPALNEPRTALAAMFIQDAMDCQSIRNYRDSPEHLRSHRIRQMLYYPVIIAALGLVVLSFIEEPRWCRTDGRCSDPHYPSWGISVLSFRHSQIVEALCLAILGVDMALWCHVLGFGQFITWNTRAVHVLCWTVSVVDLFIAAVTPDDHFRVAMYLRSCFFILYSPSLRREVRFLMKAMPQFMKIVLLLTLYCIAYAWFGVVLFPNDGEEGSKYFHEFGEALFNLQILLTTNNYPDVMMPAYTHNRGYFFFFCVFIVIGIYFFINLFIGVAYSEYMDAKTAEIEDMTRHRGEAIDAAFNCLAVSKDPVTGRRCIDVKIMEDVYAELNRNFQIRYIKNPEMKILFGLLDQTGDGLIDEKEFRKLPLLLNCEINKVETSFLETHCPVMWDSMPMRFIRRMLTTVPSIRTFTFYIPIPSLSLAHLTSRRFSLYLAAYEEGKVVNVSVKFDNIPTMAEVMERITIIFGVDYREKEGCALGDLMVLNANDEMWVRLVSVHQLQEKCQIFVQKLGSEPVDPPELPLPKPVRVKTYALEKKRERRPSLDEPPCDKPKTQLLRLKWKSITLLPPSTSYFEILVDTLMVLNAILVVIQTKSYLKGEVVEETAGGRTIDYFFTVWFLIEMILKVMVFGIRGYFASSRNKFDFLVTMLSLYAIIFTLAPNGYDNPKLLRFIVMSRLLRLIRLVALLPWFQAVFFTMLNAVPMASKVAMLLFCLMFFFATLGMDLFGGRINTDPSSKYYQMIQGTAFAEGNWYPLNFNDLSSGFVMLFACLVMNNWNSYVEGFVSVSSKWARVFFTAYWVLGALAGLNLVVSFVLDKYNEEWEKAKRNQEVRKDPTDGAFKTRAEFLRDGHTAYEWDVAERAGVGDEAWIGGDGKLIFDASKITGTDTGVTGKYYVRFLGNRTYMKDSMGRMVGTESWIPGMFHTIESPNVAGAEHDDTQQWTSPSSHP